MEGLVKRFFKHALRCEQCHEHPENPCAIGEIILSAAASEFIISAQQSVQRTCAKSPDGARHFAAGQSLILCMYCGASR